MAVDPPPDAPVENQDRDADVGPSASEGADPERLAETLRAVFEENARLRREVERVRASASFRLGTTLLAASRSSAAILRLPIRLAELHRERNAPEGEDVHRDPETARRRSLFDARLEAFLRAAAHTSARELVVFFTGTRREGIRAHRAFAMAGVLRSRDVPVLFGYEGALTKGDVPAPEDPLFLELPEEFLVARFPRLAAAELGDRLRVLNISYPTVAAARAVNLFNTSGWVTIYDALDDWEAFARAHVGTWFSPSVERYLAANADLTTAVSRPLAAKLEGIARRLVVSPNGFDPRFVPPGYARRPATPPKVGYFGHLTPAWFDWEALFSIARERPRLRFEIIGYGAPRGRTPPANVRLLGPQPPSALPGFAAEWSAGIIPFKQGPLADAVDPIKIYEYLALGLPTVGFRMPQIADYPATTTVGDVPAFVEALDRAVAAPPDPAPIRAFLARRTWAHRVDALLDEARSVLARPPIEKLLVTTEERTVLRDPRHPRAARVEEPVEPPEVRPAEAPAPRPILLFRGTLQPGSGWSTALRATAAVAPAVPDVELWIITDPTSSPAPPSEADARTLYATADALGALHRLRWFADLSPRGVARALALAGTRGVLLAPGTGPTSPRALVEACRSRRDGGASRSRAHGARDPRTASGAREEELVRVGVILGTRPEIIKMSPVIRALARRQADFFILHTGQHYSHAMDRVFFEDLALPSPRHNLDVGSGPHGAQTAKMLGGIESILARERPQAILVQGDTNTVVAGALAASKMGIRIGHVEAGLRSYDRAMPEEINRIVADHISDLLFAPTTRAAAILEKEGIPAEKIHVTGNTIVDAVRESSRLAETQSRILERLGLAPGAFVLLTVHRQENVDDPRRFAGILAGAESVGARFRLPVVYPIHPRARKMAAELGLEDALTALRVIEPASFLDFLRLEASARLILSDSGGVQEEACILRVPCVTLRDNTERPETIEVGANVLAGASPDAIVAAAEAQATRDRAWTQPLGDGRAGERIAALVLGDAPEPLEGPA